MEIKTEEGGMNWAVMVLVLVVLACVVVGLGMGLLSGNVKLFAGKDAQGEARARVIEEMAAKSTQQALEIKATMDALNAAREAARLESMKINTQRTDEIKQVVRMGMVVVAAVLSAMAVGFGVLMLFAFSLRVWIKFRQGKKAVSLPAVRVIEVGYGLKLIQSNEDGSVLVDELTGARGRLGDAEGINQIRAQALARLLEAGRKGGPERMQLFSPAKAFGEMNKNVYDVEEK